ncbi:MerR family transcriptional regulator [Rhizobium sp. FKY42]|uniref:MerR family transcriptional regulator n=1 Tax=Rhizobium sp. FKY42 TaxID=2562310 RepID=UPI0010C05A22|nr:MerR family transcriptional regulator [Rhizobium sp. FKY42]
MNGAEVLSSGKVDTILFKIAEAARMAGVSPSTLRLWESQGLIEPIRTASGQRLFDSSHIDRLKMISYLRTEKGLNPAAIREQLKQDPVDADTDSVSNEEELPPGSNLSIGQKIRRMRREASKTLDAVARDLDIPISLLSTFERTSQGLSLKGMHDLANYFGTTITSLSGQEESSGAESLIRSGKWSTWPTTFSGVTIQCLAEGRNQMECHRFVLAPGASSEGAYRHPGEEFLHILSGNLEIMLDGSNFFELAAGDSFYFESTRLHSWRNIHDGETVLIWVNTPPTF